MDKSISSYRHVAISSLVIVLALIIGIQVKSQSTQIANGINYLKSTQNTDGSWGRTTTSLSGGFPTTAAALEALRAIETSLSTNQTNAIQFLNNQTVDINPFFAARISALAGASSTTADLNVLLAARNVDGGWGTADIFESDPEDTSLALLALRAAQSTDTGAQIGGLTYLVRTQNADGGWSLSQGEDSQVFYTAYALQALNAHRLQFPFLVSLSQNKALTYLHSKQNADGGYGSPISTPFETALALLAVNGVGVPLTPAEAAATNYLNNTQQSNGSWTDDAYSTALALRALTVPVAGPPDQPPVITSQPITTAREGQPYSYQVQASDPENDPLSFVLLRGPSGMTMSNAGLVQWTPSGGDAGNRVVIIKVSDNKGASTLQEFTINVLALGVDLTPIDVNINATTTDTQTLVVGGTVRVQIQNKGASPFSGNFAVLLFSDRNGNGTYQSGIDPVLGTNRFTGGIDSNAAVQVDVRVSGVVQFRDDLIYAFADSANEIPELNETNNIFSSGESSKYQPPVNEFQPRVKWQYNQTGVDGPISSALVAPLIDTNGDGLINERDIPAVIFLTDRLTALRGDTGAVIFDIAHPAGVSFTPNFNLAVGDLEGDGVPEIIVPAFSGGVNCFSNNGMFRWTSHPSVTYSGSPTIVDLDGDGHAEILYGSSILNFDGTVRRSLRSPGYRGGVIAGGAQAVDLDLDGVPEIIAGPGASDRDGNLIWWWQTQGSGSFTVVGTLDRGATTVTIPNSIFVLNDGYTAVANLDEDPNPEIIVVSDSGLYLSLWVIEHDGRIKTGFPVGLYQEVFNQRSFVLGPPTVADFDGDGQPEIAIAAGKLVNGGATSTDASQNILAVYERDGSLKWSRDMLTVDFGLGHGTSPVAAFDFDGDGAAELVYQTSQKLIVLNGRDGTTLYEIGVGHHFITSNINPTIADVDNDGLTEIVVPSTRTVVGSPTRSGVVVLGDTRGNWRNARRIWNQWFYHITNVKEDSGIPRIAANNWQTLNNSRAQTSIDGVNTLAAPDLSVSKVTINAQSCPASLGITARVGNGGSLHVAAGQRVKFYSGDPTAGGTLIGTQQTTRALYPGEFEDVTLTGVAAPPAGPIVVTVADLPVETLATSTNLARLPNAWAQASGYSPGCTEISNLFVYRGIDGQNNTLWQYGAACNIPTNPPFYEVRFEFPVNANLVTIQNVGASNTGFLTGTLNFSNGFSTPFSFDSNGQGTITFPEQQNVSWIRLTAATTRTSGPSLSEFIVGGSYAEPQFRINEGTGRGGNNKAASGPFSGSPCDSGANQAPQITSAPPITGQVGVAYVYQVQATDPNSDPLSYSLVAGPAGMTISATGMISWTPTSDQTGDAGVTVRVSDGRGGTADQSFSINVPSPPSPNRAPQITSSPSSSVTLGQTFQYDLNALDADGDTIVFALLQAPVGATMDQFAGRILWTPNTSQAASQYFLVEAQDGKGGRDTQSFFVMVNEPPDTPPLVTLPPGTIGCSVTTDKRTYSSNSVAQITGGLQNLSATLAVPNLQAQVTVADPNGQSVFTSPVSVTTLFPHGLFKGTVAFNTGTRAPGTYRATLELRYGQQMVCGSEANFSIVSSAAQGTALLGSVIATPAVVERPASTSFDYQVSNIGNVDLGALDVKVLLVDAATENIVQTFTDQTSLNKGQSFSRSRSLSSSAVEPGDYLLVLQGQSSGITQTISSAALRINSSTLHLNSTGYTVAEGCGAATITVTRTGDSGNAVTVDYATVDASAGQRTDYTLSASTLSFGAGETSKTFTVLINEDGYVEGNETLTINLSNATNGAGVGLDGTATLTITDNDATPATTNPIDDAGLFVCEHYHDFLARQADSGGADYWTSQILQCGTDADCIRNKRIDVSNAFFFEQEFQETGAYVYRVYKAALGQRPGYKEFMPDRNRVIGGPQLGQSKANFADAFVRRPSFLAVYPASLTAPQYVDGLNANTGNSLTPAQRDALVAGLANGTETRGTVLRQVADNSTFVDREYNASFVLTQYFGYLRRDPDQGGFEFWLDQVNRFPIRNVAIQHAMVCSFITSREYQERFGSVVSHSNQECPQ